MRAVGLNGVNESNIRRQKKQEDIFNNCERTRQSFRGKQPFYPELEEYLIAFVEELHKNSKTVTRGMICLKVRVQASVIGICTSFKASAGWCDKFMRRSGLTLRRRTTVCQKLSTQYAEKLMSFKRYVIKMGKRGEYEFCYIGNADKISVYFEIIRNTIINRKGDSGVKLLSTGHEK